MEQNCRIRVLPDLLIKKIAAGEVIERPASVVKELVENAVDAKATRIALEIEDGGKQLIRITDDGVGMSAEELQLAVTPHATSKILQEEDLYRVATMGFRGEALASISAVSRMKITSKKPEALEGHEIRVAAQEVESSLVAGCPAGTSIEIRDLFFNVPARRKFLRSSSTEVGHINEQITRIALAHPTIAFETKNNGRSTLRTQGSASRLERIASFYSPELAQAMIPLERIERNVGIEGYLAPPAQSRATGQWQYSFVNGRFIRDKFIQHAIKEAYRGLIDPHRYPVVFLFITIEPGEVDVNVHPTKIEVRWANSNLIHSQVLSAIRETLRQTDLVPALNPDRAQPEVSLEDQDRLMRDMAAQLKQATPTVGGSIGASHGHAGVDLTTRDMPAAHNLGAGYAGQTESGRFRGDTGRNDAMDTWRSLYAPHDEGDDDGRSREVGSASDVMDTRGETTSYPLRAVQMHNLYLVAETDEGIVIIDQHALHERVMYEEFRRRIAEGSLESQRLLLPETVSLTTSQAATLEENAALLHSLGIETSNFGDGAVAVQSFPALLKNVNVNAFMVDLADRLEQQAGEMQAEGVLEDVLSMMACKAAVKAGDPLTQDEIDALVKQRDLVEKSTSCPHGRPTSLRFTRADLDRQFKRT